MWCGSLCSQMSKAGHWEGQPPFVTEGSLPIPVKAQYLALQSVYPEYVPHIPAWWAKGGILRAVCLLQFTVRELPGNCWGLSQQAWIWALVLWLLVESWLKSLTVLPVDKSRVERDIISSSQLRGVKWETTKPNCVYPRLAEEPPCELSTTVLIDMNNVYKRTAL